jgi:hypothetical protein
MSRTFHCGSSCEFRRGAHSPPSVPSRKSVSSFPWYPYIVRERGKNRENTPGAFFEYCTIVHNKHVLRKNFQPTTKVTFEIPLLPAYHMLSSQVRVQQLDLNHMDHVHRLD